MNRRRFRVQQVLFLAVLPVIIALVAASAVLLGQAEESAEMPPANAVQSTSRPSTVSEPTATPELPSPVALVATPTLLVTPTTTTTATAPATAVDTPASSPPASATPPPTIAAASAVFPLPVDAAAVEQILDRLSLEQKVGQMLMVGLPGVSLDWTTRQRIVEQGVGGIILLDRNALDAQALRDLTGALQQVALGDGPGLPLFIGWNHEGGIVARRQAGMTHFPSNMALGAANQPQLVYDIGQAVAQEMLSLGVNMNFAPVLDVNTNPANPVIGVRSYGGDPQQVAELGEQYVRGQQAAGVIAVAKHFPGHGGADVDSHLALPRLETPLAALQQVDIPPFQRAIEAGVGGVMVAHLQIPALDPTGSPSSLSAGVVSGLLRDQLGYQGVAMTDDMGMRAITDHYSLEEATVQAVLAGNDLLLSVESSSHPERMHQALLNAVYQGRIAEEQIDNSVRRLIRLKLAYNLDSAPPPAILPASDHHRQLARRAEAASVQLLRDETGWLPLPEPRQRILVIVPEQIHPGSTVGDGHSLLGELLSDRGVAVTELFYADQSPDSIAAAHSQALTLMPAVDATVVVTWNAGLRFAHFGEVAQEQLVRDLLATGKPTIVIFGQLPYDQSRLPDAPSQIAVYGDGYGQLERAVSLLLGFPP